MTVLYSAQAVGQIVMTFTERKKKSEEEQVGGERRGGKVELGHVKSKQYFPFYFQQGDDKIILLDDQWGMKFEQHF